MIVRAPSAVPSLGFLVGIAVGLQGAPYPPAALAALALGLSPPLAPLAFASAGWLLAAAGRAPPAEPREGSVRLDGRVASVPEPLGDRVRFRLRTADGRQLDAFAPPSPWPLAPGDDVRLGAALRAPAGPRNPGGRDPAARLAAAGVALQAFAAGPAIRTSAPSPLAPVAAARERFAAAADRVLPAREAGVVRAIGTGDRGAVDRATTLSFARSGLAHVLAVSGLHLVVVAFGLERLLRWLLLRIEPLAARADPRTVSAAIVLPAVPLYALATGAGAPVLRSAIAAGIALGGVLLRREARAANGLALALLVLLAGDPGSALDPSLQLSFAAVAGLALWSGPLRRSLPVAQPRRGTWRAGCSSRSSPGRARPWPRRSATAPVLAFHFRQLPLLGLLANVAGVPIGSALTAVSALAALAAAAWPPLATPFLLVCRPLAAALVALSDWAAAPRWGVVGVASPGLAGAAGFAAAAILATRLRGAWRAALALAAVGFLLAPGPLRAAAARARGGLEVIFVSVGQGDAALLRLPDGSAVLVDAGGAPDGGADPGARDVVPLLRDLGVRRLAAVFVSHPHPDHVLGLAAVADAFPVERVFSNGDGGDGEAREVLAALAPVALAPGERWERAGVGFEALGGPREALGPNDASLVLRVVYGRTAFLFPGDVEQRRASPPPSRAAGSAWTS